jgi:hypothetical protein
VGTCVQIMTSSRTISFRRVRDVPNEHDFVDLLRYVGIFRLQMLFHLIILKRIDDVFVVVFVLVRNLPITNHLPSPNRGSLTLIGPPPELHQFLTSLYIFMGFWRWSFPSMIRCCWSIYWFSFFNCRTIPSMFIQKSK